MSHQIRALPPLCCELVSTKLKWRKAGWGGR